MDTNIQIDKLEEQVEVKQKIYLKIIVIKL